MFIFLPILFVGCSKPLIQYHVNKKRLELKLNEKENFIINLRSPNYNNYSGRCIVKKFDINEPMHPKYDYLYIQHIKIKTNCHWSGLPSSYFINWAKKAFNAENVIKLNEEKIGHYSFTEYETFVKKRKMIVTIIQLWGSNQNTFIIDPFGRLSKDLKDRIED